jgi:hypothetical protein
MPLSGKDLKMGQNISEFTEWEEPITFLEENTFANVPNQLDKRQQPLSMQAGRLIRVSSDPNEWREDAKRCTLGFPVRRVEPTRESPWAPDSGQFNRGYLILGNCLSTNEADNQNGIFYYREALDEQIRAGIAHTSDLIYFRPLGLNFAIAKVFPKANGLRVSFIGTIRVRAEDGGLRSVELISQPHPADEGTGVCVTTGYGYGQPPQIICGTIINTYSVHSVLNPWKRPHVVKNIGLGKSQAERWGNLIKVRLEAKAIPKDYAKGIISKDHGSPVYFPIVEDDRVIMAQPVGILFDYGSEVEGVGDEQHVVYYMYCVSIDLIMENFREETGLRLIGKAPNQ